MHELQTRPNDHSEAFAEKFAKGRSLPPCCEPGRVVEHVVYKQMREQKAAFNRNRACKRTREAWKVDSAGQGWATVDAANDTL